MANIPAGFELVEDIPDGFELVEQPTEQVAQPIAAAPPAAPPAAPGSARRARRVAQKARVKQLQDEREQFLSSLPPERRQFLESITPFETALIGTGQGMVTLGRGVGLADDETEFEAEQIAALDKLSPRALFAGQILGETAPFLVPGAGLGGIASAGTRAAATAALGASEGFIIARGRQQDIGTQLLTAGIGGTVAGALELGLPVLGRIGGAFIRRVLGRSPKGLPIDAAGNPSQELLSALDESGLTMADLTDDAISQMTREALPADQAARKAILESEGLTPTTAQVTRDAGDFQAQQEAAKSSGRVRQALEQQEATLTTRFNNAVIETGGESVSATSTVADAITSKATVLDREISRLYKVAREVAPGEKNVRLDTLTAKLRDLAPSDRAAAGGVRAVVGDLQAKGVLDDRMKVVGRISVETAEDTRQLMNQLFDPQQPFRNGILRQLKDTLDDDVFTAAGKDVFREGRAAKTAFEKELRRAKISKFDKRKANLVRDILENKVSPESLATDVIFGKKWRGTDVQQLKSYLSTDAAGKQAFNDLRAEVLEKIRADAFIGPGDASGITALSRDKLEKVLKKIGKEKLGVLFTSAENKFLNTMLAVARLREPVRGTALGLGPTAQAVGKLTSQMKQGGLLSTIFSSSVDAIGLNRQSKAVLRGGAKVKPEVAPSTTRRLIAQTGAVVAAQEE